MKLNVLRWLEYRANFVIGITAMVLSDIVTVVFFWAVFLHIPSLNGWSFNQMLFMFGFWVFTGGIWHTFLAECNPSTMDRYIRNGWFDRYLMRPMDSLIHLSIQRMDDDGLGDLGSGVVMLLYSSAALGIAWNFQNVLALAVLSAGSVLVWFSLNIIFASTAFWATSVRSLMDVLWNLARFIEYPLNIYNSAVVWVLTFIIPLGFVSFYPSQYFFQNVPWIMYSFATLPVGLVMFALAYFLWNKGLKKYGSTGH